MSDCKQNGLIDEIHDQNVQLAVDMRRKVEKVAAHPDSQTSVNPGQFSTTEGKTNCVGAGGPDVWKKDGGTHTSYVQTSGDQSQASQPK